jgi:hypothetical protein
LDADTRRDPHIEEAVAWQKEKEARRAAWEADRKAEAERREREEKKDRLKDHVDRRTRQWAEHTGSPSPSSTISKWREEYLSRIAREQERDLEVRREQAARNFPI